MNLTEETRGQVELGSHLLEASIEYHPPGSIGHVTIAEMKTAVGKSMVAFSVLLCDCLLYVPHFSPPEAISPHFKRAISGRHNVSGRGLCSIIG